MFTAALLAATLAAPVLKPKASELYFPTVEGTKRVTQMRAGDRTSESTETVSKVVEKDGTYTVTVSRDVGGRVLDFVFEVSAKGVFAVADPDGKLDQPAPTLKLPAKEGNTWEAELVDAKRGVTVTITYTVGKEEEVTVPAGKYNAIPVYSSGTLNGRIPVKSTTWYAAGVGVVKGVTEVNGREQVTELKEFTPGKAK